MTWLNLIHCLYFGWKGKNILGAIIPVMENSFFKINKHTISSKSLKEKVKAKASFFINKQYTGV